MPAKLSLTQTRYELLEHFDQLLDRDGLYGAYRSGPRQRTDLYSSLDIALGRAIMGEDFEQTLSPAQREDWVTHINSFASLKYGARTGGYEDVFGHHDLHANGMVVGALGVLGGRQLSPVRFYDKFSSIQNVESWLDGLDWAGQWRASHLFWGGLHVFSCSRTCTPEWRSIVLDWLDRELDESTGWWRRGVAHTDRHQPLGGSAHILPLYEHHGRAFLYPERVIDSTLNLQLPNGVWYSLPGRMPLHYLELDALYALRLMQSYVPTYRKTDIDAALDRYIACAMEFWATSKDSVLREHPHFILAAIATFGLLQQHRPEQFVDDTTWSDIFSDRKLYRTDRVECLDGEEP